MTSSINSAQDLNEKAEELLELINEGKTIPSATEALFEVIKKLIDSAHHLLTSKFYITIIKVNLHLC